jgi:hypothetical protein
VSEPVREQARAGGTILPVRSDGKSQAALPEGTHTAKLGCMNPVHAGLITQLDLVGLQKSWNCHVIFM